ncbi:MAG: N-acetylmuramoyl-L-alanine amidase [Fimbriimonadaceae bacterium]
MIKWLVALVPWMVTTTALAQAPNAVQVEYTYLGTFKEESVRISDECWVTPALMTLWGYKLEDQGDRLGVRYQGREFDLAVQRIGEKSYVSLHEAARFLGAYVEWNERGDSLVVLSQLRIVESVEGGLRVDGTLPAQPVFFKMSNPDRFVIDLKGTKLPKDAIEVLPKGWRVGQVEPKVTRIVVETPAMAQQFVPTFTAARSFFIKFGPDAFKQELPDDEGSHGGVQDPEQTPPVVDVTVAPKPQLVLSMPNLAREDENGALFMMPFTGTLKATPSAKYVDPSTIQITIPVAEPSRQGATQGFESKYATLAEASRDAKGNAVMLFRLTEPFAFELKSNDRIVTLRLFKPKEADGGLAGKVIVVDAGHGGKETGTKWGTTYEKDLNLKVAKKVAAYLTEAGASVVMIRSEDIQVPLLSRPETANESKADLYISVHTNANAVANSASGSITFYHMQDPVSMLLAQCIQTQLAAVSKMPDMGVWSDSRIYKTKGFAVLRGAAMPAVLVEMGFLNNSKDRARLLQPEFHDAAALAIVKGIKTFLGDTDGKK